MLLTPKLPSLLAACLLLAPVYADQPAGADAQPSDQTKNLFSMDLESLLNLKVTTASKFSEKLSDAPGVMEVVTKDELRRFGGMTLAEILDRVPGLSLSAASFTDRSIVAARGDQTQINSGHVLFLINGRPTREVLEGGISGDLLQSFPVSILEKIEVILGPGSVLYGSNAFSAVVNLITQKAQGNSVTLTGLGGGGAATASSGQVSLQHGHLSIVGAGQFRQDASWTTPVQTQYLGLQNPIIPDRGKGAYLGINYKGLSFESSYTEWNTFYIEGAVGDGRWRRGFADLGYSLKPTAKWDMSFDLTYTRTTLNAVNAIPFIDRDSFEGLFEWTNVYRLSDKDRVTFGALYDYQQGRERFFAASPPLLISDGNRPGEAFYGQLEHTLVDSVKLIGGFQANRIGKLSLDVVPRGGVIWHPAAGFSLKALYSEAFRAPSLNETRIQYIPPPDIGGPSLIGNPNLLPEKVATIDIGLSFQGSRFQAGADYFHSRLTNDIILANVTNAGTYMNLGSATFQGGQLEAKYYLRKNLFLMGSALYQVNHDDYGNSNITPIANYGAKLGISYESAGGLTLSVFDAHEGPLHGYALAQNPKPRAYDLPTANFRYDLSKYLPPSSKTSLALVAHATNFINEAVWLPDWKDAPGDSTFYNHGRTIYAGIEVSLKKE
jgi:outer membrane receptor for ferrienterochelin and colicins